MGGEQEVKYEIAGYLDVKIELDEVTYFLTPLNAYLSSNKEFAIAYNYDEEKNGKENCKTISFRLDGGKFSFSIKYIKGNSNKIENMLLQLALVQKSVILIFTQADKNEIIGIKYPVK
jgi:hypothetical protein